MSSHARLVMRKEEIFQNFQTSFRNPLPTARGKFYLQQLNNGVIRPTQLLQQHLNNDRSSAFGCARLLLHILLQYLVY